MARHFTNYTCSIKPVHYKHEYDNLDDYQYYSTKSQTNVYLILYSIFGHQFFIR